MRFREKRKKKRFELACHYLNTLHCLNQWREVLRYWSKRNIQWLGDHSNKLFKQKSYPSRRGFGRVYVPNDRQKRVPFLETRVYEYCWPVLVLTSLLRHDPWSSSTAHGRSLCRTTGDRDRLISGLFTKTSGGYPVHDTFCTLFVNLTVRR